MAYPKLTPITATGATAPRYLGDRFADIVNVKDFGAAGDGVADDTTAFTAAQNSGAQAVMVPNGTYKITEDVEGTFFSFGEITITGGGDVEIIDVLSFDSIANQLSNNIQSKVALDGSNVSSIGSTLAEYMANASMPSSVSISITLPSSGSETVEMPYDGYLLFHVRANADRNVLIILEDSETALANSAFTNIYAWEADALLPVAKGHKVICYYDSNTTYERTLKLCPCVQH